MATAGYSKNLLASRIGLTGFAAWGILRQAQDRKSMEHRVKDPDTPVSMLDAKTEPFSKTIPANLFIITYWLNAWRFKCRNSLKNLSRNG
jgi:hypothetical protein